MRQYTSTLVSIYYSASIVRHILIGIFGLQYLVIYWTGVMPVLFLLFKFHIKCRRHSFDISPPQAISVCQIFPSSPIPSSSFSKAIEAASNVLSVVQGGAAISLSSAKNGPVSEIVKRNPPILVSSCTPKRKSISVSVRGFLSSFPHISCL